MDNKTSSGFFAMPLDRPEFTRDQRDLYRTLYASLSYIPLLQGFIALGFAIIYLMGQINLLDQNEPRLLVYSAIAMVAAICHLPLFWLIKKGKLVQITASLLIINSLSFAAQVLFWDGITWIPLVMTATPALVFATQRGLHRNYQVGSVAFGALVIAAILIADRSISYDRMSISNSLTQMAALSINFMVFLAMAILVLINSRVNFRTISSRLVATFTFVALLSSTATLIIAALANLYFDQQRTFQELRAASEVRTLQVGVALTNLQRDVDTTMQDSLIDERIQYILANKPGNFTYQSSFAQVRSFLLQQQSQNSRFQEILLVDKFGKSIFSTTEANSNFDFSSFDFFQNSLIGINYAVEYNFPNSIDQSSILLIKPYIQNGLTIGAIVIRTSFDSIKQILAANTGIGETAETYLVALINGKAVPITNTRKNVANMNTIPTTMAILERVNQGFDVWNNYAAKRVLGSYVRIPALKAVLIAEVEQQEVTQKTINISLTNAMIGVFTLLLAFSIVLITSRSISNPIVEMAQKATYLANGELSTRMQVIRQDEIGTLASSFDGMAGELQTLVKTLEQKVEDRTGDLQKQATYLRMAAEVARDATTAKNLDELLNRATQLILDRFSFYHTGIFLLDERKEYAVLRASPTKAGQEMLARNHKLRVGQVGIVGNVAASGVPRVTLDTSQDSSFFHNPSLPDTRSEMALPLKVGLEMVGVLDVQSERPEAFTQDDIGILQTMADQLALAIQHITLTKAQEVNLRQLETAYQHFTLSSWNAFAQDADTKAGYSFDGMHLTPIDSLPLEYQDTLSKGQSILLPASNTSGPALAMPLKLRDQVIGVLRIQFNTAAISADTINLVEEAAGRLAIALENARLYTETQKVAERERAIGEIANRLAQSVNIENILRTTVQEIGRLLPGAEVSVKLEQSSAQKPGTR